MKILKISDIKTVNHDSWLSACEVCNYATFFHTPIWAELFSESNSICSYQISFNDGKSVILPLTYQKAVKGLVKVYQSMPACTFGGWLSIDQLTDAHYKVLLNDLNRFSNLSFRENPYDLNLSKIGIQNSIEDFTYTINIQDGYDLFFQRAHYSHRKAVRKAQNNGITIISTDDKQLWDSYFEMYLQSIQRWKNNKIYSGTFYTKNFLENIRMIDKQYRTLWLAIYNSIPIAGILCFYWNKHAVAWHGAGREDYFNFRPNNLLYDTAIHDSCQRRFDWFDCNPSGGIPGVIQFKKYLGAIELRSRVISIESFINKYAKKLVSR